MGTGVLVLLRVLLSELEFGLVNGVWKEAEGEAEEGGCLVTGGEAQGFNGVGRIPDPVWKVLQLMPLKSLEGEEDPNRAWPCDLDLL